MKKVAIVPLVLGVAVGGLAIKFGLDTVQKAEAKGKVETVVAIVAADEIPATSAISETMVKAIETPVTPLIGRDSYQKVKDVVGRVAQTTIPRGAVVREELLAPVGTPSGLMVRIPSGYRAVSLKINEVSAVGYQLRPGSVVDVIAVMQSGRRREMVSRIILQRIKVLAVGRALTVEGDPNGKGRVAKSVTLLVKDSDVPKLHLAETTGKVTLAMRSPDDELMSDSGLTREGELLGKKTSVKKTGSKKTAHARPSPSVRPAVPHYSVTVVNGEGRPVTVTFDRPNSTHQVAGKGTRRGGLSSSRAAQILRDQDKDGKSFGSLPPPGQIKPIPG